MGIQGSSPSNESNTNEESVGICLFPGLSQQPTKKVLLKYSRPKKKSMFPEICSKRKNFHGRKTRTSQKKNMIIRSHPNTNNHPTL
jgi:hypothetical protein